SRLPTSRRAACGHWASYRLAGGHRGDGLPEPAAASRSSTRRDAGAPASRGKCAQPLGIEDRDLGALHADQLLMAELAEDAREMLGRQIQPRRDDALARVEHDADRRREVFVLV